MSGAVAVTAGVPFVNRHYDIAARFFVAGGVMGAVGIVTMIAGWQLEHGWERRRGLAPLPRIRRRRLWSAGFALVGLGIAAMIGGFRFDHGYSDVGRIVGGALFGILGSVGAMLLIWGTYAGRQSEIALHVGPSSIALDLRF